LLVSGAIEVVTGTGKTVNRTAQAAFCRCGHSANKPYCDGSHARVGFQA
jgi:CDGSH-type Zn-finger protein